MVVGGGVADDPDYLFELIAALKKVNKRLAFNCYLSENEYRQLLLTGEVRYTYKPAQFLNVFIKEHDFLRLYYYIADLASYQISDTKEKIVCDQFFTRTDEKSCEIKDTLCRVGFQEYAVYHKWLRKNEKRAALKSKKNINFERGYQPEFYDAILTYFDIYSDLIPQSFALEEYLSRKDCYSAVDKERGELLGGLIVTKNGKVQTEEYIFTKSTCRGRKIASMLHDKWYENTDSDTQYVAWIRDDNEASICLHINKGYTKTNIYKTTMMKG